MRDIDQGAFRTNNDIYDKKIVVETPPEREIGIDTKQTILDNIVEAGTNNLIDIGAIDAFTQMSQRRDQVYSLMDDMGEDTTIAAALEIYAEDATNMSDSGRIVWCDAEDNNVRDVVTFLIDSMNVDKNIYKWVYSLIKYGDLYLRLYRESEEQDLIFDKKERKKLDEDIRIKAYSKNDKYTHYVEMVKNPAEMFELTKFGKTYGYIKAPTNVLQRQVENMADTFANGYGFFKYNFDRSDIDIYPATEFVHAALEESTDRTSEEVNIFLPDVQSEDGEGTTVGYNVRRGQSILYNLYKTWRQLGLLESSVMLNRVTKSSIVRIIGVEVGDMPKESVQGQLNKVKRLIEQKTAINNAQSMSEYTNPGPVENSVYIPTHDGKGAITTETIGGDVNVGELTDLDYFKTRLYSGLKIPKQYLGDTDDATGFNGGSSLSLISSRYAKTVIRIQNAIVQALTDAVNLMLLDKGLDSYINEFSIKITPPITQEDVDRREAINNRVGVVNDVMNIIDSQVSDELSKLKMLKDLLSDILIDSEIPYILQEEIDKLENNNNEEEQTEQGDEDATDLEFRNSTADDSVDVNVNMPDNVSDTSLDFERENSSDEQGEEVLPTADELDVDLT